MHNAKKSLKYKIQYLISGAFIPLEPHPKRKKQAIDKENIHSAIPITGFGTQSPSKP